MRWAASSAALLPLLSVALSAAGCPASHRLGPDAGSDGSGEPCGAVMCPAGRVCCNATCGVCTAPGERCFAIECVDAGFPCAPDDARGEGPCRVLLGWAWMGDHCAAIAGCDCIGADCGELSVDAESCSTPHRECLRRCGGRSVLSCLRGEICDYPDGSYCGGDDSTGVCIPRPTECADPGGIPVCGCDGNDYVSECSAQLAGTDAAHRGRCMSR